MIDQRVADRLRRLSATVRQASNDYLPAAAADRLTTVARRARTTQQDRRRAAAGDDGTYFDQIVAEAIEQGRE